MVMSYIVGKFIKWRLKTSKKCELPHPNIEKKSFQNVQRKFDPFHQKISPGPKNEQK